ncbi:PAS domain-containing sensor histidine kinase [Alicyclobacillus mengziensis]|uniref:histidine kinase n=1 Tax=Alicyclobacillus mengziensis TaxID=2931921 RepID=A0A9X7Z5S0_9BACL|nr:PAS domain-containing sensor histidine kinase [Alicyclobacillus mengziensis]QSO47179.1 PAS domain S-box protein [Alicyclobacillus mengziensis]
MQFGIIIFPIAIYQMITFGRAYTQLPLRTFVMGLYGGGAAVLSQMMPVHILSQAENFQCVPVILSILYGKRKAGFLAVGILSLYQFTALPLTSAIPAVIAILVYSAIPMAICEQFERDQRKQRFLVSIALTVITLVVELMFLLVYLFIVYGINGLSRLAAYGDFLAIACVIQLVLMSTVFFLLEHLIENAQVRRRYQSLIDYNPVGICAFNVHNQVVGANAAFETITGYKERELVGKSRLELWFEEDYNLAGKILYDLYRGEIKKNFETAIKHKDGHKVEIRATMVPMVEGNKVRGYFSMITDIADEKMAEAVLRESEKLSAIGQLAAGVAHEIRNPLTSIKGFVHLLAQKAGDEDKSYYDIVKSELSRIEGIVSEMLVLAKPQAISYKPVSIQNKVQEVVNLLSAQANMQNVSITVDSDEGASTYGAPICGASQDGVPGARELFPMGDGNQLKQVFLNLAKNAIEAMPTGGSLSIRIQHLVDKVTVTFTDTGEGMPPDHLVKLGQPFYTTKMDGTGLGLVVSKRIISNHSGRIDFQSTPGQGTVVAVTLPAVSAVGSMEHSHLRDSLYSSQGSVPLEPSALQLPVVMNEETIPRVSISAATTPVVPNAASEPMARQESAVEDSNGFNLMASR